MPNPFSALSSKEKALSAAIVVFFAFCLFQQQGSGREDWPFSFFGMYQYPTPNFRIVRYDLDYLAPGKPPVSLYRRADGYYFMHKFREIGNRRKVAPNKEVLDDGGELELGDEVIREMRHVLVDDAVPIVDKEGYSDAGARIRLRYRMWKDFDPADINKPLQDVVILEPTVTELRASR